MLKVTGFIVGVAIAMVGFVLAKHKTTRLCDAGAAAISAEIPAIIDELSRSDARFRALKVGGILLSGSDAVVKAVAASVVRAYVADAHPAECLAMAVRREFDPIGFREDVGAHLSDALAESLSF